MDKKSDILQAEAALFAQFNLKKVTTDIPHIISPKEFDIDFVEL